MDNTARKFNDVFAKIPLSKDIVKNLNRAQVNAIKINKRNKTMDLDLHLEEIVHERYITEFSEQLKCTFPFLEDFSLQIQYKMHDIALDKKLSMFWENIIYITANTSPLCARILQESNWELAGNCLTVNVKNNGSFIFSKKALDRKIEKILNSRFKTDLKVMFKDEVQGEIKKQEYTSELLRMESELIAKMMESSKENRDNDEKPKREQSSSQMPKKSFNENKEKFFAKGKDFGNRLKGVKVNHEISEEPASLSAELEKDEEIVVMGRIFELEIRETKSGRNIISMDLTDNKNSVTVKFFISPDKFQDECSSFVKKGSTVAIKGKVQFDEYTKEINIIAEQIGKGKELPKRTDNYPEKRVELHLHTQMSSMDAINTATDYIEQALKWGHKAIAITDHGVVQSFPEAMVTSKGKDIKILYGVEAYLIDDLGAIVQCPQEYNLDSQFVVFDIETTGLAKETDSIIEIGAVKIKNRQIVDTFSAFINPHVKLPEAIVKLTGITDDMLTDAPEITSVLEEFLGFVQDSILVAHNASFDVGFVTVQAKKMGIELENSVMDTVELCRTLYPELQNHKLDTVAKHLNISLENHHRAIDDAKATAEIFLICAERLMEKNIYSLQEVNIYGSKEINLNKLKYFHAIILVQNYTGLRNLYELISKAHIHYFFKRPRIPKSELIRLREGLIVGTACEAGELYKAIINNKPNLYIKEIAEFYDYYEIQPYHNNMYLIREKKVNSIADLIKINKEIVTLGEKFQKPVVATCDVHFMNPEDDIYRKIIMAGEGYKDVDNQAPLYFRTTEEMLKEFEYLGEAKAKEVVIENTNKIADLIEVIKPIPDETFPPKIDGAEEQIKEITMKRAKEVYGEELPQIVLDRLERELNSIIKNGFSVMYIIAQKLVWKSLEDGYLVGSRGSVGSSLVAAMAGITEVNSLPPHYLCSKCFYSDFTSETVKQFAGGSGCDMPDMDCPVCGSKLNKDGHDIPFETFLGFDGDKEPDIDLNFSGEYQAKAHAYTEELFGSDHVFKAGTIGTLADKTAYGLVKKYLDERNIVSRNAEINRLKTGCTGIKRTTGQHPGGLMIVPNGHSIYEFCPVQRPANDQTSNVTTTHFDYHAISGRLLKLDILGHDVPTIIRMLHDTSGVDPQTIDLGNKEVLSLFSSPEALGVTAEDIQCKTGTLGLPEFGTNFVRQMLLETKPSSFAELVRISGLSHGTDVWINNGQDLIKQGIATLKEIIPTRDDIMVYLINKGVEKKAAFKIMENVRKGKGVTEAEEEIMEEADVPEWYIESCKRIKYMFPKGHAVAYVMMTIRIGYYKIYHPYSFYAACFSVKAEDFDYELMCFGKEKVIETIKNINALGKDATAKEKNTLTIAELVLEMYSRGLQFAPLDLYKALANKFLITDSGLMAPLCSIQGLGTNAAQTVVEARENGEFFTIADLRERTKLNKTVIEILKRVGVLDGLSETNQMSLF